MDYYEKQLTSEIKYAGRIVTLRNDTAELVNGNIVNREVVEHPGGVAVVPVDSDGFVVAVRQFRYPFMQELLEIPAGKLEAGEDPAVCAVRELSEETGYTASELVNLGKLYTSPGYCNETLYLYLALGLTRGEAHPDLNELLCVERLPLSSFSEMIMSGEICDAKTIVSILKAEKYLNKLRKN